MLSRTLINSWIKKKNLINQMLLIIGLVYVQELNRETKHFTLNIHGT